MERRWRRCGPFGDLLAVTARARTRRCNWLQRARVGFMAVFPLSIASSIMLARSLEGAQTCLSARLQFSFGEIAT